MARMSTRIANTSLKSCELEALLYDMAVKHGLFVPIDKTSFKYKHYMIIKGPDSLWHVFLLKPSKQLIGQTILKVSAFAICKLHDMGNKYLIKNVKNEDKIFERNYIDSLYYSEVYHQTSNDITRDTTLWRYELAQTKAKEAKARVDRIFYNSIT